MTPRVAILRGEALNPYELQSYAPLLASYDVFAIGAAGGFYDLSPIRVPIVRLRQNGRGRVARRLLGDRAGRLRGPDSVLSQCAIVHSAETFLPISEQAAELRAKHGFKLALTCWENIPFRHDEDKRLSARKRTVRGAADVFVAVTEAARQALLIENVPSDRIVVQPVGVDTQVFRPTGCDESLLREWAVPDGWTSVLYCGRLIREKGVLDLVRALVELPRTVLILVGEGSELPRIRVAAAACGVDDRIRYIGPVAYASMPRFYSTADVFCLPSVSTPYWQEQFGMVLVEAMACGIPVVTTATGSIPEVVGDAAVVVPPYSPNELAAALASLLEDPQRRTALADSGLQRVIEHFDAVRVAASIGQIYSQLLTV